MMRPISSPGSSTNASRVTGSPMIEQLHCNMRLAGKDESVQRGLRRFLGLADHIFHEYIIQKNRG